MAGQGNSARARRGAGAQGQGQADEGDRGTAESNPMRRRAAFLAGGVAFFAAAAAAWGAVKEQEPKVYSFRVIREYKHDPKAFTQGLLWANGSLYESTGLYGRSAVREVRLLDDGTSKVVRETRLDSRDFGEGLVQYEGDLYQLLWRKGEGIRYKAKAGEGGLLERAKGSRFKTTLSDGWGLETDGKSFIVTDSGKDIIYLNPQSFKEEKRLTVNDDGAEVEMVNELEFVDGELWGNVYGNECLARIDPSSGSVKGWVLLDGILDRTSAGEEAKKAGREPPDVLNGIAWDGEKKRLFVTGKLWPKLYEIEVVPAPQLPLEAVRKACIPRTNIFRKR
eukprot:TRINITY_DN8597_c0_g1_i1.p1 TRINITY_DN8597_c0_g1~~TRINITY_DN8597_c0_g1_i1.p1  ORF type:complete len:359 (-),score=61.75 TRINITY_DN8597_c0_g1_i1:124-1131(-)